MPSVECHFAAIKGWISQILNRAVLSLPKWAASQRCEGGAAESEQRRRNSEPTIPSARMSYNRLQALDGAGYRECYLEKIRSVSRENEGPNSNRDYWFGETVRPPVSGQTEQSASGQADAIPTCGIRQTIPSQARITNTRLQAYVDRSVKPGNNID